MSKTLNVGSLKSKADLDEGELGVAGDKHVNIGLEVSASPHCQDRHFHLGARMEQVSD